MIDINIYYICNMTALFNDIIFGPIHSRRLGLSLGVNLLPTESKLCNFDCIYCECGWNNEHSGVRRFNNKEEVISKLVETLDRMSNKNALPNVITFAGNGEPTLHPDFKEIIERTLEVRDRYSKEIKVSVLSNATQIGKESVHEALMLVDNNILKIDSALDHTARLINNPSSSNYTIAGVVENMKLFNGNLTIQTMFLRGEYNGQRVDNTTEEEITAWLKLLQEVVPSQVMIYSLDRDTPCKTLEKVEKEELHKIADRVKAIGIEILTA